jgi:Zn ribbon nucleic-acid-binding protein
MQKSCRQCAQQFEITAEDLVFYDKVSPIFAGKKYPIPPPSLCPDCRNQRRLAFRNERKLYSRKCDATGRRIISIYSSDKPYKVYGQSFWFGDKWDAIDHGQEIDFSKSFFKQFNELLLKVPHPAVSQFNCENCDYTTYQNNSKNCYLTFGSGWMDDCAYCNWTYYSRNSLDSLGSNNLELCYEMIDCDRMYASRFCQDCSGLMDCAYCHDCHSCQNCFGCVGLRQKKYCFLNKQLTEPEYREKIKNLDNKKFLEAFATLKPATPHRAVCKLNCENCSGDHLIQCKNVSESFQMTKSQDCCFSQEIVENKDCYDCNRTGLSELSSEVVGGGWYYKSLFCVVCSNIAESFYVFSCLNSKYLFGCAALKNRKYCILNKQYSKEEYERLVPQLIEKMTKEKEWGEFFPMSISPFAYNETIAQDFTPLNAESTAKIGMQWLEPDSKQYMPQTYKVPSAIAYVPSTIVNEILACRSCRKNFKIIPSELEHYKKAGIPVPDLCPDCRLENRLKMRNPRKLYPRQCAKCGAKIQTTYAPDRQEKVYCEQCYLKEVY